MGHPGQGERQPENEEWGEACWFAGLSLLWAFQCNPKEGTRSSLEDLRACRRAYTQPHSCPHLPALQVDCCMSEPLSSTTLPLGANSNRQMNRKKQEKEIYSIWPQWKEGQRSSDSPLNLPSGSCSQIKFKQMARARNIPPLRMRTTAPHWLGSRLILQGDKFLAP